MAGKTEGESPHSLRAQGSGREPGNLCDPFLGKATVERMEGGKGGEAGEEGEGGMSGKGKRS